MPERKPLIKTDGEVRELTATDMKHFRPAKDALPATLLRKLKGRGSQKAPTKERITIRLSPDVVERFRASGRGWQTRIDNALSSWLRSHNP